MLQYIVQPGDSLYFIALKFNVSVQSLMELNRIKDPNAVYTGQMLQIPLPYSAAGKTDNFPSLRLGSTGPFVILVQGQLTKLGYYMGPLDGIYGNITQGSVIQFQISRNLRATGIVDPVTWKQLLEEVEASVYSPPFQARMVLSGLLMVFSLDKPSYQPGDRIVMTLLKLNLSNQNIELQYSTGQRYDFKITYPSGRTLWRWSETKAFTQALGTLSLSPGQSVRYTESYQLSPSQEPGLYHLFGWNSARQLDHVKLHIPIQLIRS